MSQLFLLILVLTFAVTWLITGQVQRYALVRNVLDVPNARSSHTNPTPRGGGVAFVITLIVSGLAVTSLGLWSTASALAVLGSGVIVAVTGFIDDHHHIPARWRLLAHFLAAAWALYWLDGAPPLTIAGLEVGTSITWTVLAAFFLVWMLNLYNFMDGIDGIASVQAISVSLGGALLYALVGHHDLSFAPLLLAAAVSGFLIWNFPPARIFMGDAGSGFLGIVLGIMALQAGWVHQTLFWAWLIMLGVFIVDSTYTLARRLVRGERVYEAHRSHAYQLASRRYGGHLPVTLTVLLINVLWLWPLAYVAAVGLVAGWVVTVIAYLPLLALAVWLKAGGVEKRHAS